MSDKEECPSFKYKDFQVGAEVVVKSAPFRVYKIESVCLHTCTAELDEDRVLWQEVGSGTYGG